MYLPKSKYSVEIAKPGQYSINEKNYIGPVLTTYLGETFAGTSPDNLIGKVEKIIEGGEIQVTQSVAGRRVPTENEYKQGYMDRYFLQDLRSWKVIEILPETYTSSMQNPTTHSKVGKVEWILTGSSIPNKITLETVEYTFPGIVSSGVLSDPEQWVKK